MIVTGATAVEAVRDLCPHTFVMWRVDSNDAHRLMSDGDDSADIRLVARSEYDADGHARIAEVYTLGKGWEVWVREGDDALGFVTGFNPADAGEALWAGARFLACGADEMMKHGLSLAEKPQVSP